MQTKSMLLYADKSWYIEQPAKEKIFSGTLISSYEVLGPFNRESTFSIKMKEGTFKLYDPDKLISPRLINTKVIIQGKLIDDEPSGISNEIWPGIIY